MTIPVGRRGGRQLLGRWGWPLIGFSALGVVGSFVFAWGWIADDLPTPIGDMMITLLPLFAMVTIFSLLASARLVGSREGYVDVVGLFLRRRIPIEEIARVDSSRGLKIYLTSGRTIGSIAYGQSLIGETVGYPRSRRTASRIAELCDSVRASGTDRGAVEYSVALRAGDILAACCLGVVLVAVTIILTHR
jgi:hypothetical protein